VIEYNRGAEKCVVLVDCGVTYSVLRSLAQRNIHVIRTPWDYDYSHIPYDGLVISGGPGNPDHCHATVTHLEEALHHEKAILGICMGNLLLAKASGAKTCKLKYGHRSHNQPVRKVGSTQCFITPQNHGYAVESDSLNADWEPLFINLNDGTNEGIRHKSKPFLSAHFHSEPLFDDFLKLL
jgi:carbamoyl-phosphate synthase small subunit